MAEQTDPFKSVEEARQFAKSIDENPCIPQALHYALNQIGAADLLKAALRKSDNHLSDALDSQLNDTDRALMHSRDLHMVDPALPEADRKAIEDIRQQTSDKLLMAAHPFNDAAMPPKPTSCRGR